PPQFAARVMKMFLRDRGADKGGFVPSLSEPQLNSARFSEASTIADGSVLPRVDFVPKRTQAAKCIAQSLLFAGDGFCDCLLNPVKNRSLGVGNKGRESGRIGLQHGKLIEFLPILRAGRAVG